MHSHILAKRNFQPSKWERIKVNKIVQGILLGRIKLDPPNKDEEEIFFDIWEQKEDQDQPKLPPAISAPKLKLPSHSESYHPPKEYLLTKVLELFFSSLILNDIFYQPNQN